MGIKSTLKGYPAETLGGLENGVSPLEMATAYASIANGGLRVRPTAITKIRFPDGRVEKGDSLPPRFRVKRTRIFSDGVAAKATEILKQNLTGGTGGRAYAYMSQCPAAGKTGTVDDNTDAWFVGFTPRMSTSVWVGYPDDELVGMSYQFFGGPVDGGTFPAQIWGDYMNRVKGSYCGDFAPPKEPFVSSPFFGRYANSGGKYIEGGDRGDDDGGVHDGHDDTDAARRRRSPRRARRRRRRAAGQRRLRPRRLRVAAAGRARDAGPGAIPTGPGRRRGRARRAERSASFTSARPCAGITPADVSARAAAREACGKAVPGSTPRASTRQ